MQPSTGLGNLDKILHLLRPGDNVVWQVDSVEEYAAFTGPFWRAAIERGERLVYFRFAQHRELVPADVGVRTVPLAPEKGFERFITKIHKVIAEEGKGVNYIFDMFSELVRRWYSERMVGNFFMLTCPFLYASDTIAYFAVLRNFHSYFASQPIAETTQLLIDVYRFQDKLYVHPLKVDQRYSATMHLLHRWEGDDFLPVLDSATTAQIANAGVWPGLRSASYRMVGMWDRRFMQAEEVLSLYNQGEATKEAVDRSFANLVTQLLSRDERIIELIKQYLTLEDVIHVWKRTVGSGMIGGKAVGMLLARAIICRTQPRWYKLLERHDSFYIGSDIFYMFLVQNDCWWIRQRQKNTDTLLDSISEARWRILRGKFPDQILQRFSDMLEYFGQSPIIVRSSSLLEDAFGNAFAGKYESVFCTNQGTHRQRMEEFLNAVRVVYASAMSEEALVYRSKRGVLEEDEQMALLVQRVSGVQHSNLFYPQVAGVGFSVNPYVWHKDIDPEAGMLRLVFGLGTRAVDRLDDDYTRVVALNAPFKRPEGSKDEVVRYSQKMVDYLDLEQNRFCTGYFDQVLEQSPDLPVTLFAEQHRELEGRSRTKKAHWIINIDHLFEEYPFIDDMRQLLQVLQEAYGCHVDIEYTAHVLPDGGYRLNLLQCRPLQIQQTEFLPDETVPHLSGENTVLRAQGAVLGYGRRLVVDRLIYIVPTEYGALPTQSRYMVAKEIGRLVHATQQDEDVTIMLVGPGRFGTKMPELGVPVSFAEINGVSVLCEVDTIHEGLTPDLSLGTHFFHELMEMDMLYLGLFHKREGNLLNSSWLEHCPNLLPELLGQDTEFAHVVRFIAAPKGKQLILYADHLGQNATLYLS